MSISQMKIMLITFFHFKGIVHFNSFHKAKQFAKLMWKYGSGYMKLYIEEGL
jgi:hypothetical protein